MISINWLDKSIQRQFAKYQFRLGEVKEPSNSDGMIVLQNEVVCKLSKVKD